MNRAGARESPPRWGPEPDRPVAGVVIHTWGGDLLEQVGKIEKELDVPVQAVRSDRVLSMDHVRMALWHQRRAVQGDRLRVQDPGVAFLRFLAGRKQISRALEDLGVPLKEPSKVPVLFVALMEVDPRLLAGAVQAVGLEPVGVEAVMSGGALGDEARRFWDLRLGLAPGVSGEDRWDALLALMALVSLEA